LREHIQMAYAKRIPLFVWGTFGIGKSQTIAWVAKELNLQFTDVRISQLDPSDLRGLPITSNGETRWLPPNWLPRDKNSKGILCFDELNLAPPSIQASAYQLILDRRLGDYILPDGWVIISAGNRIEDRASVFDLSAPLANRFTHIELGVPDTQAWSDWGLGNGVDSRVIAFLNFKPSRLFSFDGKIKEKAIPTPRSWAFCSRLIDGVDDYDLLERLIASAVGEGTAIEMIAFLKLQRKIDIKKILEHPESVKEIKEIDLKYSLLSVVTEYYKKNKTKTTLEKLIAVCNNMEAEFAVLLLRFVKAVDTAFFTKEIIKASGYKELSKNYAQYLL